MANDKNPHDDRYTFGEWIDGDNGKIVGFLIGVAAAVSLVVVLIGQIF